MSRRANGTTPAPSSYCTDLRAAIHAFLPRRGLPLVLAGDRKLRWVPRMLVVAAILIAWDGAARLVDRFAAARDAVAAMFPSRRRPGACGEGFWRTLAARSAGLLAVVAPALRRHVRRAAGRRHWRVGRWAVFGVDGSRVECPRTKANEAAFGSAGRRKTGPQQFLTTLFHVGTGLVWDFRRGDARASERAHLLAMLPALPRRRCLLLADAGFTGYDLLAALRGTGRSFVIRVGRNVRLLRKLGWVADEHDGVVYLWPAKARDRRDPPLVLRLVTLTDGRNRRTHLLTDVLDRAALPDAAVGALYRRRWGVELLYRSLKQTMGRRRLLCGSPAAATAELDWAVVGLWLLGLISVGRLAAAGQAPDRWGVAASLRAVRRAIGVVAAAARCRPCRRRTPSLGDELARATKDAYARRGPRRARDWPHKKRDRPPGDPRARNASESEVALAAELRSKGAAA